MTAGSGAIHISEKKRNRLRTASFSGWKTEEGGDTVDVLFHVPFRKVRVLSVFFLVERKGELRVGLRGGGRGGEGGMTGKGYCGREENAKKQSFDQSVTLPFLKGKEPAITA